MLDKLDAMPILRQYPRAFVCVVLILVYDLLHFTMCRNERYQRYNSDDTDHSRCWEHVSQINMVARLPTLGRLRGIAPEPEGVT